MRASVLIAFARWQRRSRTLAPVAGCGCDADSWCPRARTPVLEPVTGSAVLDAAGRRRSPATMPGFHVGRPPRNKGLRYPADPPTVEEIVAVMRAAGDRLHGRRLRGLVVVLWRAGLRIDEALALREPDLDRRRGSLLVRRGKGGQRREVGIDDWRWQELEPWLDARVALPIGPLFCVITGRTCGRPWTASGARAELRRTAAHRPVSAAGLLPISCAMRTRSRVGLSGSGSTPDRLDAPRRGRCTWRSAATSARLPRGSRPDDTSRRDANRAAGRACPARLTCYRSHGGGAERMAACLGAIGGLDRRAM